jgi:hypothetical protein
MAVMMWALILLVSLAFSTGCATSGDNPVAVAPDSVTSVSISYRPWRIAIAGSLEGSITQVSYDSLKQAQGNQKNYQSLAVERKGTTSTYEGMLLATLLEHLSGTLDRIQWEAGYGITLCAEDGYSVTFATSEMPYDALVVYDRKDGEWALPGTISASASSQFFIKGLASITIDFQEALEINPFLFEISINGIGHSFSLADLEKTPCYTTGRGGYTTSAGTYYEQDYAGIRLAQFIQSFLPGMPEGTVDIIATDGYTMSYAYDDLSDTSSGTWILAFKADGEYLPDDPGPIRGIKITETGSSLPVPNIDGHNSPKMVHKVAVAGEVFRDFSLLITGKLSSELDRTTLQAGINCTAHKTEVAYLNKKSGELEHYTGISLHALLAYGDDPLNAPHKQMDKSMLAYDQALAQKGYQVKIIAGDGYSITLDSRDIDGNDAVIIAMYQDGAELQGSDWPLKLVWDSNAERVPDGIKAVRNVVAIELVF